MSALSALVYVLDAWILGTYALLAKRGKARPFHWANAVGAIPTVTFEVLVHAWPIIPLTGTFGVLGWVGLWSTRRRKPVYVAGLLERLEEYACPTVDHTGEMCSGCHINYPPYEPQTAENHTAGWCQLGDCFR